MVYKTRVDACTAAAEMMEVQRMLFVSITPWGAYEVSTHSIHLNAPVVRLRKLGSKVETNKAGFITGTGLFVETVNVTNWRRN